MQARPEDLARLARRAGTVLAGPTAPTSTSSLDDRAEANILETSHSHPKGGGDALCCFSRTATQCYHSKPTARGIRACHE